MKGGGTYNTFYSATVGLFTLLITVVVIAWFIAALASGR